MKSVHMGLSQLASLLVYAPRPLHIMRISSDALRELGSPGDDVALAAVVAWLKSQQLDCMEDLKYIKNLKDLDGKSAKWPLGLFVKCVRARCRLGFQPDFGIHRGGFGWQHPRSVERRGVQEKEEWLLGFRQYPPGRKYSDGPGQQAQAPASVGGVKVRMCTQAG